MATKSSKVVIASGTSLSGGYDLGSREINSVVAGFQMPSAWTAANLTFQVSTDDATYQNLYDDAGNEVTVTAADSRFITLDTAQRSNYDGIRFIKIRSGTSGSPVNQGSDRTIQVVIQ